MKRKELKEGTSIDRYRDDFSLARGHQRSAHVYVVCISLYFANVNKNISRTECKKLSSASLNTCSAHNDHTFSGFDLGHKITDHPTARSA